MLLRFAGAPTLACGDARHTERQRNCPGDIMHGHRQQKLHLSSGWKVLQPTLQGLRMLCTLKEIDVIG